MRSFTFFILTFLSLNVPVLAGSRGWQPALVDKPGLIRRWATISLESRAERTKPWPDRKITYCLNDDTFGEGKDKDKKKKKMRKSIHNAHKLWRQSGLSEDFTVSEGTDEFCRDPGNQKKFLLVSLGQHLATTPGYPKEGERGAETTLSFREDIGMLDIVPNIAHELGHAWGLHHEHQNPYFWGSGVIGGEGGTVFGPANNGNWKCEHLKDYAAFADGKLISPGGTQMPRHYSREELCNSYALASVVRFSAAEYLPMPAGSIDVETSSAAGAGSVDWDSIMIYPSGAGGIDSGEAQENDGDERLSILEQPPADSGELRKREGGRHRIKKNKVPSPRDIVGITHLYGDIQVKKSGLLQTRKSVSNLFKKAFLSSGSGDSSTCS